MSRNRVAILLLTLLVAVGVVTYWMMVRFDRETKAVENGVVEFKKGNYESAVRILSPYADQGNHAAQLNVGIAYAFGKGAAKDRDRARRLLQSALGGKATEMYVWIAKSFETGDGVQKDAAEAAAWYRIASEAGSAEAQEWLRNRASPNPSSPPGTSNG